VILSVAVSLVPSVFPVIIMRSLSLSPTRFSRITFLIFCVGAILSTTRAQQNQPPATTTTPPDDVVRVNTDIVQTDVIALDKQGRFVDNLRREQFELLVDGKPQPITFFERVAAGSMSEERQLAAARGQSASQGIEGVTRPLDRGRTIFFFIDDLHMAADSLMRIRTTLLQFIDKEMGQNDQVAITSTNGQIGFLQQLTDNKTVLRAAVARLKTFERSLNDSQTPQMSEILALAIDTRNDQNVIKYFVDALAKDSAFMQLGRASARPNSGNSVGSSDDVLETLVRNRARRILQQSYNLSRNTLSTLESLARRSAELPGRKLVFFVSDGFLINPHKSDMSDRIRNLTNAAARNGVVIYSLDSRGLATIDMGRDGEMEGLSSRYLTEELTTTREPLQIIAANTGGRTLLNNNDFNAGFTKAIQETSVYYLLAWRPENAEQLKDKFRQIEVRVIERPDLNVLVRRGYYDVATNTAAKASEVKTADAPAKPPQEELREAISSLYPVKALPTQLCLVYVDMPDKGMVLTASIQIATHFMTFSHTEDKQTAILDLAGVVLDDKGKSVASFKDRVNVNVNSAKETDPANPNLIYNFQSPLKPGLYQVRVAVHDSKGGRTGSAMQWIEIPDLASHHLSLSSLLLGETTKETETQKGSQPSMTVAPLSVDHYFSRSSSLRFLTYIYNAAQSADKATNDVALQVQILRDDQPVVTTALRKVASSGLLDQTRIPYAAEIQLETLLPGRYVLQITAIDRLAKTSASQRANFVIE
jgi:VWFA-related protein